MLSETLSRIKFRPLHVSPAVLEQGGRLFFILLSIAVMSYALVGLFYDVLSITMLRGKIVTGPTANVAMPLSASLKQPAESYGVIPQRNIFGSTDKAVATKQTDAAKPAEGPDISLLLEVKGTIAGTGQDGFAVIEEKGKNKQVLYKVGNMVAGAKLIKIARNTVTFLIGDQEKILKMTLTHEGPLLPSRPVPPAGSTSRGASPFVVSRSEVDASLKDMGTMLSQAQIRPYYTDGVPDGFLISNIRPGSIYEKIGLVNGDIIQGTDDRKLITAEDVTSLYNTMKAGSSLTLKILRGGRQENMQFVFR